MTEEGPPVMSDAEREVLKVLWDHGPLACPRRGERGLPKRARPGRGPR